MLPPSSILLLLAATSPANPSSATWEKVFDGGADFLIYAVEASGRDNWIAGGSKGLVTATKDGTKVEPAHDRGVLGLFAESPTSIYALGQGELIWHFDGKKWTEEHVGPLPAKGQDRGPRRGADQLNFAFYENASPGAPLVALGPSLVLARRPDGTWAKPADERARQKLWKAGQRGPQLSAPPAKCGALAWRWLRKDLAMFFCADHRAFIYEGGTVTAKGKMPRQCGPAIISIEYVRGEIYASCDSATLWKTDDQTWRQIAAPREKGLDEIPSIAVADGCLFVAGDRGVWRSCGP
jgi:hypothetical protein